MQARPLSTPNSGGAVSLSVLIPFLAVFGAGLYSIVGLPHIPNQSLELPDASSLEASLRSSRPSLDGAIYLVGMVGWGVWGWLILSLALQLLATGAERIAAGTSAVRQLRTVADVLSVPLVRRAVQTSLAGGMVLRVALAGVPTAAGAAPQDHSVVVTIASPRADTPASARLEHMAAAEDRTEDIPAGSVVYTVQQGDNLARIAERFYGNGDKWQVLYEANQGRRMQDGRTFDHAGVIHPGWQLIVPEPNGAVQFDAEGKSWYTVRKGDSLAAISRRLLGDEQNWPELFEVNQGARLDSIHALKDPRLIWPGLVLRVPALDREPAADEPAAPTTQQVPDPAGESDSPSPAQVAPATSRGDAQPTTPAVPFPNALTSASPSAVQGAAVVQPRAEDQLATSSSPSTVAAAPAAASQPAEATRSPSGSGEARERVVSPAVGSVLGASAAVIGLAGTALVLRRRHPRPGRTQPESDVIVKAGYAEAEPTVEFNRQASGDDLNPAFAICARMSRALGAELLGRSGSNAEAMSVKGASLAAVRHGRSSTTLMLQHVPMAARAQLIAALPGAATRAFGPKSDVEGMVSRDGDVLVRLTGVADQVGTARLDDGPSGLPEAWPTPSILLRVGLLADRQVFAVNWDAVSHLLVAAPVSHGGEAVLGALLASLVAQRSPAELGLIVLAGSRALPAELLGVTHLLEAPVDPQDEKAALDAISLVADELERRIASCDGEWPDVVLVVPELADLNAEHYTALGPIMLHGPTYHVRVVAASVRPAVQLVQSCPVLAEFGTRFVLRTADEDDSIALLGSGDATELGPGGHLLARIEGRVPLQVLGYRVAPDCLARLAAAIQITAAPIEWWGSGQRNVDSEPGPGSAAAVTDGSEVSAESMGVLEPLVIPLQEVVQQETNAGRGADAQGDSESTGRLSCDESDHLSESQQLELPETVVVATNDANGDPPADQRSEVPTSQSERGPDRLRAEQDSTAQPVPRPRLRARFLGARELLYDDKVIWPLPGDPDEAAMELIVFLGVQDPSGARSEVLGDSFWEDDDDGARPDRLKKRRYRLRLALKRLAPNLDGDPLARMDKQHPVHRLNGAVIESDVHRFLKLVETARSVGPSEAVAAYEEALDLYRGDLLDRPDVPPYRWLDEGPRLVDLRVKYARIQQQVRRRLADLLASGTEPQLARAEELYIGLAEDDALDHRLWEALARLHGRRGDLLGLEATARRLRSALVELGEGEDPERVPVPPALERVFMEVRLSLLNGQAA